MEDGFGFCFWVCVWKGCKLEGRCRRRGGFGVVSYYRGRWVLKDE